MMRRLSFWFEKYILLTTHSLLYYLFLSQKFLNIIMWLFLFLFLALTILFKYNIFWTLLWWKWLKLQNLYYQLISLGTTFFCRRPFCTFGEYECDWETDHFNSQRIWIWQINSPNLHWLCKIELLKSPRWTVNGKR